MWPWLRSPRQSLSWITALALLLLTFVMLVHVDLFLRTLRTQLPLSLALLFNTVVFAVAIVGIAARAGQIGWLLGAGATLGAATAWVSTELFPALSFLDPEGNSWPGHGLLHLMTAHIANTGNTTFAAEILYLLLWVRTTGSSSPAVARLRWAILSVSLVLVAGFVVVLVLGGGAGERYGGTG